MIKKLNVFFAFFSYAGNGGIACQHPSIQRWFVKTMLKMKADPRVADPVMDMDFTDTPITMTRNRAVKVARSMGADVLVMVDSDQHPDLYEGKGSKPFWDTSFDYLWERHERGPVVIGAPYCGPPPMENVYAFSWANWETNSPNADMSLEQYTRSEASKLSGIQECAALPTGLIMFDLRIFDLLAPPWFYYEYTDKEESEKASTEDVTCTRDIALIGMEKLGYNPIHCNWDAWAGHWKPKCVGKPQMLSTENVNAKYREAILSGRSVSERLIQVGSPKSTEEFLRRLRKNPANGAPIDA